MKYDYKYLLLFILFLCQIAGIDAQYREKLPRQEGEKSAAAREQPLPGPANPPEKKIIKYRWPLDINNGYSSSFQEFRSSHFHAGCDLRTWQKTGFPVYAIADGTIYKIRAAKYGTGRALYLKHDDGNTSVYFHLERFEEKLERLLTLIRQTKKKKHIGGYLLPNPLRYKRGEIIAYSGETGSGFPHLHVEIRDKNYFALNPFQWIEFPGKDKKFPVLKGLLLRNRGDNPIDGKIGETFIGFQKKAFDHYVTRQPIVITGAFDMVLSATDISDTGRRAAPYAISASIDDFPYFQLKFDAFSGDDNNQLGFVYDMYYSNTGSYFFNLFSQRGFSLEQKRIPFGQAIENLEPGKHMLRILVKDNYDNVTVGEVPFYKIRKPRLVISGPRKSEGTNDRKLFMEIEALTAEPPPFGVIKIGVFNSLHRKISSGTLHYHTITESRPLVLEGVSENAAYIDFDFYANNVHYYKKRVPVKTDRLAAITGIDIEFFLNRDEVYILVKDKRLADRDLRLTVIQGDSSQVLEPRCGSDLIYFRYTPLNRESPVRLHFSLQKDGEKVVEIQKKMDLLYLQEGARQNFKYHEFEAWFDARSVYEPRVLKVEERNYPSEYPVLSRQIDVSPYHFPFLDTVLFKFKAELPNPKQVGIFRYNPQSRGWSSVSTTYDAGTATYTRKVRSPGIFALMRDIYPPTVWFRRPEARYKKLLQRLVVKMGDRGKGVNDSSIKVWLNGRRICTGYDCACEYDPDWRSYTIKELGDLKAGENLLRIQVKDYAGNKTDRLFNFTLK